MHYHNNHSLDAIVGVALFIRMSWGACKLVVFVASTAATWCKERLDVLLVNRGKWSTVQTNQKMKSFYFLQHSLVTRICFHYQCMVFSQPSWNLSCAWTHVCWISRIFFFNIFFCFWASIWAMFVKPCCSDETSGTSSSSTSSTSWYHISIQNPTKFKKKNLGHTHEMHISINEDSFCSNIFGTHLLCVHM